VITLLPVIGLIHIGRYASADRFTYVPHIGVFVLFAWGAGELVQGGSKSGTLTGSRRAAMAVTAVLILAALAGCTYRQVGYWRDDITLFTRAIDAVPGNYLGHDNLGSVLFDRGDTDAAIAHFREAVRIEPKFMHAYKNLAAIYWQQSKLAEAEATLREALRVSPDFAPAHQALGLLLAQERKLDEAVAHLAEAVRLDPGNQDYEADLEQVERTRAGGR
jgi:tetratricopeptide (TPR) repeat protein